MFLNKTKEICFLDAFNWQVYPPMPRSAVSPPMLPYSRSHPLASQFAGNFSVAPHEHTVRLRVQQESLLAQRRFLTDWEDATLPKHLNMCRARGRLLIRLGQL